VKGGSACQHGTREGAAIERQGEREYKTRGRGTGGSTPRQQAKYSELGFGAPGEFAS